ncbi:MAG: T9SS type A sorting domain-containing protein [Candidatus Cloacimonetes bacterium]|nr:T9SS type A sorting domain-containing protein [Candidatus Cloacimonadota bacterium]
MKKKFYIIILIVFVVKIIFCTDSLFVSFGSSPVIDGVISPNEWDDASPITYEAGFSGDEMTITCYFKHNGIDTLYIAQHIPDMHNGDRNLICFDVEQNGGNNPQTDDFSCNRYHLDSYSSWEGTGTGSDWNYSDPDGWFCALSGAAWGWEGDLGEIEFAIAFSKLGITAGNPKILGFNILFGELLGNYDPDVLWNWSTNGDYFIPNTWGNMISPDNWSSEVSINDNNLPNYYENFSMMNYPNPFNPTTNIFFSTTKNTGNTKIEVYNIKGQKVKTLVNEKLETGDHSIVWNGKNDSGKQVTSGIYFYKLKSGKYTATKKMILMK